MKGDGNCTPLISLRVTDVMEENDGIYPNLDRTH